MKKGGYQIIDFDGIILEDAVGHVVDGIYEAIEGSKKVLLISGLNYNNGEDEFEVRDFFSTPKLQGSNFIIQIPNTNYTLNIQDNDVVTLTD